MNIHSEEDEPEHAWRKRVAGQKRTIHDFPPVYPNGWFKLFDSYELPIGKVQYLFVLGLNLAVYRGDQDHQVHAVEAYCPHLGANLGIDGTVSKDCLQCPFHGWKFDSSGNRVDIPYSTGEATNNKSAKLISYSIYEVDNSVLLWYHSDQQNIPEWKPNASFSASSVEFRGKSRHFVNCHIQDIPENGCDYAHFSHLHHDAIFLSSIISHTWDPSWKPSKVRKWESEIVYKIGWKIWGRELPFGHVESKINQIGPGLVSIRFSTTFGNLYLQQSVTPRGPLYQEVNLSLYADKWVPIVYSNFILYSSTLQFERDLPIWNNKIFYSSPMLVKGDGDIKRFRRWYSQFFCDESPTLKSIALAEKNTLDW
eukprot:TRINITY_DN4977_c0_g1_i1.p1 TRINITY_DN4977_c0_g1~~TRINITY_DN4977_c0_g1_i1.p1  ORF type:complete len:403 (+),score=31.81 TRINITY_DN4977_c0_g1_i1:111-1211(+)